MEERWRQQRTLRLNSSTKVFVRHPELLLSAGQPRPTPCGQTDSVVDLIDYGGLSTPTFFIKLRQWHNASTNVLSCFVANLLVSSHDDAITPSLKSS